MFDLRTFANALNDASSSHPIGALQKLRATLHGKQQRGHKIFTWQTTTAERAFHLGGRSELQFNISFDGSKGELLRSGVAFSFETSQSFPRIEPLIDKARLFNEFLRIHPDLYGDMRMWHWKNGKRSTEYTPGPIPPELATKGVFVFLGHRRPIGASSHDVVLDDFDRLLPLYTFIESQGRVQRLPEGGDKKFIFRSGRNPRLAATKASYAQRELDVLLRHNLLQQALHNQLAAKHGSENVHKEVATGIGISVDVAVRQKDGYWFYEIKTFLSPRACIREAIGQLLEYAFWPGSQEASRLIIVGETAPDDATLEYCRRLQQRFSLPIEYEQIIL